MEILRKTSLLLTLIGIWAFSSLAQQASLAPSQKPSATLVNRLQLVIEGKVINVHDGDTVTVLDQNNKKTHIRLQGIDAPELKQEFGSVSQQNLSRMVLGKQVTIVWTKLDKYRRTVGTIMLEGRDINIEQVRAGLAWHFKKYEDEQNQEDRRTYAAAEQQARAAKLGLWVDPNPMPPGDWRADVKTKRWGPPPPEGTVIGNSNSRKYHRPDCPGYRDMAERNRVFFKSVIEAEAAGYKRAGNCPPEDQSVSATASTSSATSGSTQSATTSKSLSVLPPLQKSSVTPQAIQPGAIIGNKNSHIYHVPGCSTYESVSDKNRVLFISAEEAKKAGYRKSKACH